VIQHLTILEGLPSFPAARQRADLALILKGQRLWECFVESRLEESDMPHAAPNELHENPVIRLCVAAHDTDSIGEYKAKVIHRLILGSQLPSESKDNY
jgi:hypothetical protein